MGMETLAAFDPTGFAAPIFQGIEQSKEARRQAAIVQEDNLEQAKAFREDARSFRKTQELGFLKSGLTLEGSPLEILAKSREDAHKDYQNIIKRGYQQSDSIRRQGRRALTSGLNQGIGNAMQFGQQVGMMALTGGLSGPPRRPQGGQQGVAMNYQRGSSSNYA